MGPGASRYRLELFLLHPRSLGQLAEYFFDLDHIPESCAWEPRDFPEQDALYRSCPDPPTDFGENKELG